MKGICVCLLMWGLGLFGLTPLYVQGEECQASCSKLSSWRTGLYGNAYTLYYKEPQTYTSLVATGRVALGFASNFLWRRILSDQLGNAEALAKANHAPSLGLKNWLLVRNAGVCSRLTSNFCDNAIISSMYSFVPNDASPVTRGITLGLLGGVTTPFSYLTMARTNSMDEWLLKKRPSPRSYFDIMKKDYSYFYRGMGPKIGGDIFSWMAFFKISQIYQREYEKGTSFPWGPFFLYTGLSVVAEGVCTFPFSCIRIDMQKNASMKRTFWQTTKAMYAEHGWKAFMRGAKTFVPVSFMWGGIDLLYLNLMTAFHKDDARRRALQK